MTVFLDTNIVIYRIEMAPGFGTRATTHLANLAGAGHAFAVSDLVRMECRVLPARRADARLLGPYDALFAAASLQVLPITAAVCDRATLLREAHNYKPMDALQLAPAIVHGCDRFLTADARLSRCPTLSWTSYPDD